MAVTGHFIIYYVAQVWGPGRSVLLTAVLYASADFHDWQILHGHLGHWWPQMASAYTTQCVVLATWPTALTSNFKSSVIMFQIDVVNMMCGTFSSVTSDPVTQ